MDIIKHKCKNLTYKLTYYSIITYGNCLQAIQKQRRKILVVVITKHYPYKCCGIFQTNLRIFFKMAEDKIPTELVSQLLDGADNDTSEPEAGTGFNNIDKSQSSGSNVSLIDGSIFEGTKENERRYSLFVAEPFDEPKPKTKPFVPEKKTTTN